MSLQKSAAATTLVSMLGCTIVPVGHSGRTDSNGCHTDSSTGVYHCHNGGGGGSGGGGSSDRESSDAALTGLIVGSLLVAAAGGGLLWWYAASRSSSPEDVSSRTKHI